MPVIGFLDPESLEPTAPLVAAFRNGLSEIGYVEGRNVRSNSAGHTTIGIVCQIWRPIWCAAVWRQSPLGGARAATVDTGGRGRQPRVLDLPERGWNP